MASGLASAGRGSPSGASNGSIGARVAAPGELGVPIYLVNGTRLADNYHQLWIEDGYNSLLTQPNIDESGSERSTPVWTGTQVGGRPLYPLGAPFATFGNSEYVDSRYLDEATLPSDIFELALYGISSTLTIPPGMVANVTQSTSYHTLQEALDNAVSGDAIEIAEGTLSEDGIVFPSGLNVTITGAGKDLTFIDGGTDGTDGEAILKLNDGQTAATVISHLTLLNGADDTGTSQGSLKVVDTSPTFRDVAFRDATGMAGAVATSKWEPRISDPSRRFKTKSLPSRVMRSGSLPRRNSIPSLRNTSSSGATMSGSSRPNSCLSRPTMLTLEPKRRNICPNSQAM